jgi:CheY-like chemotaxis protein
MAHRIYLVDDDRFLLNLYAAKFKTSGEEVTGFGSAEELLANLRAAAGKQEAAPDAILIDLIMPGIDGFTALETIKKEGLAKGAKLMILSNEGQEADIDRARTLGIDGYIIKASAIPSEVLAEVERTISGTPSPGISRAT